MLSAIYEAENAEAGGKHVCAFHSGKSDLLELLIPYFLAGLTNNELCIWVVSDLISRDEAIHSIKRAAADRDIHLDRGNMEILSHADWYLEDGVFRADRVMEAWRKRLFGALAKGYRCLRVTGDTAWLGPGDWDKFIGYEDEVGREFARDAFIAVCTYPIKQTPLSRVNEVLTTHQYGVTKRCREWTLLQPPDTGATVSSKGG